MWRPQRYGTGASAVIILPIYLPFTALAIPTALLFYLDRRTTRRTRAGRCPTCAYNRAGLPSPSTPCPECGTPPLRL